MTTPARIVSFLPSATEMAFALGLGSQLVGVTHECDYPAEVLGKPIVVRSVLPIQNMTQAEIDAAVAQRMRSGLSLYQVDEALLQKLAPDLILTQNLCQVCAPSGSEVSEVLKALTKQPEIIWLSPQSLKEIAANLQQLGEATDHIEAAEELIATGRAKLEKIAATTRTLKYRPRVFCIEWLDPIYCSGHWLPEMVEIAGGVDDLARKGADSVRIPWSDVVQWAPEILIVTPCGFKLEKVVEQVPQLMNYPGWFNLPAVRNGKVYAVDANSYFARPGPRVVEGTALLAHLFHPDLFAWEGPSSAFRRVGLSAAGSSSIPPRTLPEKRMRKK